MAMVGCDPEQMRPLASRLRDVSSAVRANVDDLEATIRSVAWEGGDAEHLRRRFGAHVVPASGKLADRMTELSRLLEANAADQDRASAATSIEASLTKLVAGISAALRSPTLSPAEQIEARYAENRRHAGKYADDCRSRAKQLDEQIRRLKAGEENKSFWGSMSDVVTLNFSNDDRIRELERERDLLNKRAVAFEKIGKSNRQIIQLTTDKPPRISEVVGDLSSADTVTFLIPVTGTTLENFRKVVDSATSLRDAQNDVDAGRNHVVIASLSYEAPTGLDVDPVDMAGDFASGAFLQRASDDVGEFVKSVPIPAGATVNAVGHSYGSTALGKATVESELHWDNFVGAGSPGVTVDNASALGAGDVFMSAESGDPITGIGNSWFEQWGDPYSPEFGATQLGNYDPGLNSGAHSRYFMERYGRLKEIARATTDR